MDTSWFCLSDVFSFVDHLPYSPTPISVLVVQMRSSVSQDEQMCILDLADERAAVPGHGDCFQRWVHIPSRTSQCHGVLVQGLWKELPKKDKVSFPLRSLRGKC